MGKFQKGHAKVGGRVAGVANRRTLDFRQRILHSGLAPADYLHRVMSDEGEPTHLRVDCAKALCNFVYPRMASVDVNSASGQPLVVNVLRFTDPQVEVTQLGQGGAWIDGAADVVA